MGMEIASAADGQKRSGRKGVSNRLLQSVDFSTFSASISPPELRRRFLGRELSGCCEFGFGKN